ncbi:MAG TPA: hypothetical protein ENK52_00335 [Saprospiraceae bacterium]|nr:hypothetical protein [Saprospiraceae bacterium]
MDQNREELRTLIEREDVVSKVMQLIDLKINFYGNSNQNGNEKIVEFLEILHDRLDADNALQVLELLLDGNFENFDLEELMTKVS